MTWVALDDNFAEHEKVVELKDRSFRLHVAALCYCGRNLTDGFLSPRTVKVLAAILDAPSVKRNVSELVSAGLWLEMGDGAYSIKDYLVYNPSATEVKALREKRREAGRRGGINSGRTRREANAQASAEASASPNAKARARSTVLEPPPLPSQKINPAVELSTEHGRELDRIIGSLRRVDEGTYGVLAPLASRLPLSVLADVRERCAGKGPGWVVNALRAELEERAA